MECPFIDENCGECFAYDLGTEKGRKEADYIRKDIREQIKYGIKTGELWKEQGDEILRDCNKCYELRIAQVQKERDKDKQAFAKLGIIF
jgi:hypothetical protein